MKMTSETKSLFFSFCRFSLALLASSIFTEAATPEDRSSYSTKARRRAGDSTELSDSRLPYYKTPDASRGEQVILSNSSCPPPNPASITSVLESLWRFFECDTTDEDERVDSVCKWTQTRPVLFNAAVAREVKAFEDGASIPTQVAFWEKVKECAGVQPGRSVSSLQQYVIDNGAEVPWCFRSP